MAEPESVLRFEHVSVGFNTTDALNDVSFDVKTGQTRVILGAAGSGKTVLLKTAVGLNCPSGGKVFLFNEEIENKREQELYAIRQRVGVLFQEGALFDSMTVERNVAYPLLNRNGQNGGKAQKPDLPAVHKRIEEALNFVEVGQALKQFPSELSGGMQRRVAIARAFVTNPPLLLYDSPTAGLDPITAHTIVTLIIKERDVDQTTAMVVTHRYQDGALIANFRYNPENAQLEPWAEATERTIFMVLHEGRLVFEGHQEELEKSDDEYLRKFVKRD